MKNQHGTLRNCDNKFLIVSSTKSRYYHSNHLGSASWITDKYGAPVQYIHYLPYGEIYANQTVGEYNERFKFTGKELDRETGYHNFEARQLLSLLGTFLSVDPLADNFI